MDYVHLIAVIVWIGGALFYEKIVHPNLATLPPDQAGPVTGAILKKFNIIVWVMIIVIGVGGFLRAFLSGALNQRILMNTTYGNLLLLKIALYAIMVLVGIKLTQISMSIPTLSPQEIPKAQARLMTLAQANTVFGLITILVAVAMA